MHWADAFVKDLEGKQTVSTGISPSGHIHVGNMREILTGYFFHRALQDKGTESRFIYLCDDIDPLRKVYPFLKREQYEQHVGKPLSSIPAPEGEGTYSEYFLKPFLETLETIGVKVEVIRSTDLYRDGVFEKAIDIVMNNVPRIREILETVSGRQLEANWAPYNPICSACGRINSTSVKGYTYPYIEYTCKCGNSGKADIRKNEGKLPWRIEWPAKWYALGVTIEPFGKDHGAAGGSYDTGKAIAEEIFGIEAPKYLIYERIFLKGKGAMHSSTGNVIAASEMVKSAPPEILRFLIARSQPSRHIEFDPGLGLLNLVDEYERYRNVFYGLAEAADEDDARTYELSRVMEEKPDTFVSFRHLITLVQIYPTEDMLLKALQRGGYGGTELSSYLRKQVEIANSWLETYAPEQVKFSLLPQDSKVELTQEETALASSFLGKMDSIEWTPEGIHNTIHELIKEQNLQPKTGFAAFYKILIGKERGPRLGYFLSNLDRDRIQQRFKAVLA
jgi:lysyl-tRNA synthetase class 1